MMDTEVQDVYIQRAAAEKQILQLLRTKRRRLGWLRLVIIVITFIAAMYAFPLSIVAGWLVVIAGIACFLVAVAYDASNNQHIAHHERMLHINEEELLIIQHQFTHRYDGHHFQPHEHPYAADLDLFGEYSLFQYINRCTSQQGNALLAERFLQPFDAGFIIEEQEAVKELSANINWRQELQAKGMENPVTTASENKINDWLQKEMPYAAPGWKLLTTIYPLLTFGAIAAYAFELIPSAIFSALIFVFFVFGLNISKRVNETYALLSKMVNEVVTLQSQLAHFEKLQVQSSLFKKLQDQLQQHGKASASILQLKQILNRFDYRLNILVFFVLNTLLLWDLRQLLALRKWRQQHQHDISIWFSTIAHLEVLNSLATLLYNHPAWVFPQLSEAHFTLHAGEVGHPLIKEEKRVNNSFSTSGTGRVSIITGSNMAGKSTFLRSVGVNIVLAQMGAPVCAKSFTISPVHLYTSMRIADNLAENTSTFYAELKKLKTIIEQVNKKEKVFILLDEILRGTNSLDRHTGSKALVKQLIGQRAVAVIATHDVELAALEQSYITSIKNYHFDVQVQGEELYFDYKLKQGICKSLNASILMKKIGINIEP